MASLKKQVRRSRAKLESKEDTTIDGVLELSVTIGYLGSDVKKEEMGKIQRLLLDHCVAGLVALERGELEQRLHFQMVCQARTKSARSFGILVRKYMEWYGIRNMSPAGKVTCKVLTNRLLHTWKGMLGYCLKDDSKTHFECLMHNISDEDVEAGKTLHSIYGKADLKNRVVLTNKNIGDRAYVWFKYREKRQLTATMLSTLTDMIHYALFIPSASWIIPVTGLGMEQRRMNSFWKCLTDPTNVERAEVADVFIRKREYVRGRYYDEDDLTMPGGSANDYVYQGKTRREAKKVAVSPVKKEVDGDVVGVGAGVVARDGVGVGAGVRRKLFEEPTSEIRPAKSVKFADSLGDFIPLKDRAPLPTHICLPTVDVASNSCQTKTSLTKSAFWNSLTKSRPLSIGSAVTQEGVQVSRNRHEAARVPARGSSEEEVAQKIVIELSSDSEEELAPAEPDVNVRGSCLRRKVVAERASSEEEVAQKTVIELSSDSDEEPAIPSAVIEISSDSDEDILGDWPKSLPDVVEDRKPGPSYFKAGNVASTIVKTEILPDQYYDAKCASVTY